MLSEAEVKGKSLRMSLVSYPLPDSFDWNISSV